MGNDVGGEKRRGALLVPVGGEPVAHDLLVEAQHLLRGGGAGGVGRGVPVAAGVTGENLIGESNDPGLAVGTELKLGVSENDAALGSDRRRLGEDLQRQVAQGCCGLETDELDGALERDVLVVLAVGSLPRGGVDGLGQLVAVAEPGGQSNAADTLRLLILEPAAAGEIRAHDTFHGEHVEVGHEHGAAFNRLGDFSLAQVVRNIELVEPPVAQAGEQRAFARDTRF